MGFVHRLRGVDPVLRPASRDANCQSVFSPLQTATETHSPLRSSADPPGGAIAWHRALVRGPVPPDLGIETRRPYRVAPAAKPTFGGIIENRIFPTNVFSDRPRWCHAWIASITSSLVPFPQRTGFLTAEAGTDQGLAFAAQVPRRGAGQLGVFGPEARCGKRPDDNVRVARAERLLSTTSVEPVPPTPRRARPRANCRNTGLPPNTGQDRRARCSLSAVPLRWRD